MSNPLVPEQSIRHSRSIYDLAPDWEDVMRVLDKDAAALPLEPYKYTPYPERVFHASGDQTAAG